MWVSIVYVPYYVVSSLRVKSVPSSSYTLPPHSSVLQAAEGKPVVSLDSGDASAQS